MPGNSFPRQGIHQEEPFDFTWSSRGSSQKAGMYFAHSTSTRSCCFMDSHTSLMVAIFFMEMSVLCTGLRDKYWKRKHPAVSGADPGCFITLHSEDPTHQGPEKCSHCGWALVLSCVQLTAHGAASTRWCSVPTHTQPCCRLAQDTISIPIPSSSQQLCVSASHQPLQPDVQNGSSCSP